MRSLFLGLMLFAATAAQAQTVAVIHAKAWTLTQLGAIEDASIVINDGKIVSVTAGAAAPAGARVIDAKGRPVTPGLVNAATHLGLFEVSAAADTVDSSTKAANLGPDFDASYALNSNSTLIQLARADGLTRAISYPVHSGKPPFSGSGMLLHLGDGPDVLERANVGVFAVIGNHFGDPGASRAAAWQLLRRALDEANRASDESKKTADDGKKSSGDPTKPNASPEQLALEPVLAGKSPLVISTNRASDLRQSIRLAKDYSVRVIIIGAAEGWMVANELAAAKIPVVVDPELNLPSNFDELGARLDNVKLLHDAGVTVVTATLSGIHQSFNAGEMLRENAGLAVANGLPYDVALQSITLTPAKVWGLDAHCGTLAPGKDADLVIWDGDPLEPASAPVAVLVGGKSVSLVIRQTELRDRYMRKLGLKAGR